MSNANKLLNYNLVLDDINKMAKDLSFIGLNNCKTCQEILFIILDFFKKTFEKEFEYCGYFNILENKNQLHLFPFPLSNILIVIKLINDEGFAGVFHHNNNYEIKQRTH